MPGSEGDPEGFTAEGSLKDFKGIILLAGFLEDPWTIRFFQAFNKSVVQKRDLDLIMSLCSQLELLVADDGLTADELKKLDP